MGMQGFSCIYPVYQSTPNGRDLTGLLRAYAAYPKEVKQRVQFVIVDDGSPVPVEVPGGLDADILHVRILQDIPWNVSGAKNLGVVLSRWSDVLVTDVDHLVPLETMAGLLLGPPPSNAAYFFSRLEAGEEARPHPGTFFMSRARFLENHGMDEDFAGHYGFEDVHFTSYQRARGTRFFKLEHHVEVFKSDDGLDRGVTRNASFNQALLNEKTRPDGVIEHGGRMLRFAWKVVRSETPLSPTSTEALSASLSGA